MIREMIECDICGDSVPNILPPGALDHALPDGWTHGPGVMRHHCPECSAKLDAHMLATIERMTRGKPC